MRHVGRQRGNSSLRPAWLFLAMGLGCGASPGAPATGSVSVEISPARSLRQGQGDVTLSLARAAGGLSRASGFALGDLAVAKDPASTDARLVLRVSVPHGAAPGPRTLTLAGVQGASSLPDVVDVGPIAIAPSGADTAPGTASAPFRTLKQALQVAGEKDTVQVAAGTYDTPGGETWAYDLPAGITIAGQSQTTTTLRGAGADGASFAAIGLIAHGALGLRDLMLDGFNMDLEVAGPGDLALTAVTVRHGGDAGSAIHIDDSAGGSRASLDGVTVEGDVLVLDAAATLTIIGSTFRHGTTGIDFVGTDLSVADSTIADFGNFGINFSGSTLVLSGVTIQGGNYNVYQLSGRSKVRRSKLLDYLTVGYYLAEGDLDLGTQTEAGDNAFSSTAAAALGIYVQATVNPVTCSNTTFNGDLPPTGVRTAGDQPIIVPGEYLISSGKTISFWTL